MESKTTLAVQLTVPLVGPVEDFHLQVTQDEFLS
jgi:hypothetical protein